MKNVIKFPMLLTSLVLLMLPKKSKPRYKQPEIKVAINVQTLQKNALAANILESKTL
jgi:hypothetical protein